MDAWIDHVTRCGLAARLMKQALILCAVATLPAGCTRVLRSEAAPSVRSTPQPRTVTRVTEMNPTPTQSMPPIRTVRLGTSVHGKPLMLHVFGDEGETVFIMGGIHGTEPTSAYVAQKLVEYLEANPTVIRGRTVGILAQANPDGLARQRRTNANGVDLNRNFPAQNWKRSGRTNGPRPASEPETRAISRAIKLLNPDCAVAIHSIARGRHCNNYDGPARRQASILSRYNHYPVEATMGYATPGSFGSWMGVDHKIPTLTLELPRDASGSQCWRDNQPALLALLRTDFGVMGK